MDEPATSPVPRILLFIGAAFLCFVGLMVWWVAVPMKNFMGRFAVYRDPKTNEIKVFENTMSWINVLWHFGCHYTPRGLQRSMFMSKWMTSGTNIFSMRIPDRRVIVPATGIDGVEYEVDVIVDIRIVDAKTFVYENLVYPIENYFEDDLMRFLAETFVNFDPAAPLDGYNRKILPEYRKDGMKVSMRVSEVRDMDEKYAQYRDTVTQYREALEKLQETQPMTTDIAEKMWYTYINLQVAERALKIRGISE